MTKRLIITGTEDNEFIDLLFLTVLSITADNCKMEIDRVVLK